MLAGEQRRRTDYRHLHPRQRRHESRPHRDLGLAEAHVTHHQPVHRRTLFQVRHHIGNRRQLIVGLLIREPRRKGLPDRMRSLQNRRVAQGAFRRNPHQPVGNLLDALLELGLLRLPRPAAQPVQQAFLMPIAAEKLDILDGQVKLGIFGIFQHYTGMRGTQRRDRLDPKITPHAMFDMHHQVAHA